MTADNWLAIFMVVLFIIVAVMLIKGPPDKRKGNKQNVDSKEQV